MLKKSIIIAAALASACAFAAGSEWQISGSGGKTATVIPSTVRSYQNRLGNIQHDALVDLKSIIVDMRVRYAVVGCGAGQGIVAPVDPTGEPTSASDIREWTADGNRMYDQISVLICAAALRKIDRQKPKASSI